METVSNNYYTAVTLHMIILLILLGIQTISSGSSSQSVNDDQMYRCNVIQNYANRNRYLTVQGIKYVSSIFNIYFKLQDVLLLLLKSTRQVLLSLSVGQLIQLMLMDM